MLVLSPLVLQLISLGLKYTPELIDAAQTEISLLNSNSQPTAEQFLAIEAAMADAHRTLQAAIPLE